MRHFLFLACAIWSALSPPAGAELVHRWLFNEAAGSAPAGRQFVDATSGAVATVRGVGATSTGSALKLPGTTNGAQPAGSISAYVDLPNGLFSSKTNLTVELWATVFSSRFGQRLFDFGRPMSDGDGAGLAGEWTGTTGTGPSAGDPIGDSLYLALQVADDLRTSRLGLRLRGVADVVRNDPVAASLGVPVHYVLTFAEGIGNFGAAGGQARWYRNGALVGALDVPFHLSALADVNNWLGRAQASDLSTSNVAYDEVRIYNHAFTAAEATASFRAGPQKRFVVPATQPDTVTMHYGQKALVPVLANDTGGDPARVTIAQAPQYGTAAADAQGRILYTHTTGAPASDTLQYRVANADGTSAPTTLTITFAQTLRITSRGLNVPAAPPPTSVQLGAAFGTLAFTQPLCLASPPRDTQRLFICEKTGLVKVIPSVTAATRTASVFLDLPALLRSRGEALSSEGEQGLLGLAFHPQYAVNRFFYLFYSAIKSGHVYERVSRFTAKAAQPNAADPASEVVLIEQLDEASNHNGGDLHFGPDGYLYISLGDEGAANDAFNNSQNIAKDFFSGLLRIDVDKRPTSIAPTAHASVKTDSGVARYAVPKDNPFVRTSLGGPWNGQFNGATVAATAAVRTEFWAVGLRNPWRFSFDAQTGELWLGDVGQGAYEEVDVITRGGNYGWAFREGNHAGPKATAAPTGFDANLHAKPLYEYLHTSFPGNATFKGNSITGGLVYRGARFASLAGKYIFADYVSGGIWALTRNGSSVPTVTRVAGATGIAALGADPSNGDVLLADLDHNRILRLTATKAAGTFPETLSATNLFADLTDLSPAPGLLPYAPNVPFWSDFAVKRRWFTTKTVGAFTWARDAAWRFADGTIWVKHFDLPLARHNPPSALDAPTPSKRIETRLLVKNAAGVYGVSYRWNDAGTEATLVGDEGADFDVDLTQNGQPYTQSWHIPSRAECLSCHNAAAGYALSFNTRQMNRVETINGFAGNQLDLLRDAGYLANTPESPNLLPRHLSQQETAYPVEARVRSYLAVNCAPCHQAGGPAPTTWDGRPELTLDQTGLLNTAPLDSGGDAANKLVAPGDVVHSVLVHHLAATKGFSRMPPLASNELDRNSIELVEEWIQQALPGRQSYDQWRLANFGSATSAEGAPANDFDGDHHLNRDEFIAGTDPRDGAKFYEPAMATMGNTVRITIDLPANRSAQVETSSDLTNWSLWDVSGNNGLPLPGGPVTIMGPLSGPQQFFRLRLGEN